mmetsp:Transcript_49260/g.159228  ORF Transcript_49260/g.159228 Transcript_49260/m.159228 type:complete len:867 (-) Transcript_49260:102-2702(-)
MAREPKQRRSRFIVCATLFSAVMALHVLLSVFVGMSETSSRSRRTKGYLRGGIPLPLIEDVDPGFGGAASADDQAAVLEESLALSEEVAAVLASGDAANSRNQSDSTAAPPDATKLRAHEAREEALAGKEKAEAASDAADSAGLEADAAALHASCGDGGPFPCHERGCPRSSVTCKDLVLSCEKTFDKVFDKPPTRALAHFAVGEICPRTCRRCGSFNVSREEVLRSQAAAGPVGQMVSALDNCTAGASDECAGGRGVWGRIWELAPPVGENTAYRPPHDLAGYKALTDGTSHSDLPPRDEKGCLRYFRVGDRGDMRGTVRPMLRELGMCESKEEVGFTFLWSRPWEKIEAFFRPKKITPGSIVNSIAGLPQQVGQKTSLARLHVACMARAGYDPLDVIPKRGPFCRFTSRAFAVRKMGSKLQLPYRRFREYNVQLNEEEPEEHRIWILKPQGGFNQVGIHMYSLATADIASDSATAAWLMQRVPEGTWVLQEYLMNPMTYQGHKFDLRVWALVTSLDPLRVYLLGTGIPKVSQWNYSKAVEDVKEPCIHVLMPGTNECFQNKRANVLTPYPTRTNTQEWFDKVIPSGRDFWTQRAWPSVEWRVVELLVLARDAILHVDHQLKRNGLRYKRVFFLSPDILIDQHGQATMVEVNVNGYMIGNLHKSFFPLHEEQRAVFRLMGGNGFPKQHKYAAALEQQTAAFCKRRKAKCTPAAEREIWEMVHEDMHCAMAWYRIFPTGEDRPHTARLKGSPSYQRSFTFLDGVMFDWLQHGWAPLHQLDQNRSVVVAQTPPSADLPPPKARAKPRQQKPASAAKIPEAHLNTMHRMPAGLAPAGGDASADDELAVLRARIAELERKGQGEAGRGR